MANKSSTKNKEMSPRDKALRAEKLRDLAGQISELSRAPMVTRDALSDALKRNESLKVTATNAGLHSATMHGIKAQSNDTPWAALMNWANAARREANTLGA